MELVLLTHVLCVQHLVGSNPSEEHWLWFNAVGIYLYCESISKYYALLLVSTSYMIKNHWFLLFLCYGKRYSTLLTSAVYQTSNSSPWFCFLTARMKHLAEQGINLSHLQQPVFIVLKLGLNILFLGQLCGSVVIFYLMFCRCTIWYLPYSEMFNQTC